ncbi:MAG: PhzF family phenazine biosynthesis protein [Bacteroidetes bacterium]|nr:PhzF family phenazine biosynthesis protein [Bacteroidota bacterium]
MNNAGSYQYYTCDVFTDKQFCGNQLAVLPDARGLTTLQMQQIAREFNFSEITFVFPPESGGTRKVRIFTPATEVPFAGHPNIGTACVLASIGELGDSYASSGIVFEEKAGPVPITFSTSGHASGDKQLWCELKAPEKFSLGAVMPVEAVAAAVSLDPDDIVVSTHPPQIASVGLPFLIVELRDISALQRAMADIDGLRKLAAMGITPDIHLYIRSNDDFAIRARMFAPMDGVPEDPATGSANCALAGLLAYCSEDLSGEYSWRIAQGVEMGRPSILEARAEKKNSEVISVHIGGSCVMVSEGMITAI